MSILGDYLKDSRTNKGLSQSKVFQATGITDSRLCKAEKGADGTLTALELKKLAVLYDVAVVPMFIMAGYLDASDLEEYRSSFKNTSLLEADEKKHIQDQIDFIIAKKG